jgi:hypothetical protein
MKINDDNVPLAIIKRNLIRKNTIARANYELKNISNKNNKKTLVRIDSVNEFHTFEDWQDKLTIYHKKFNRKRVVVKGSIF